MAKTNWKTIRDDIAQRILEGALQPGDKLPTEPELAATFSVGRHSVRRAVADLARIGKLSVEQGRGTFVEPTPRIEYAIALRTRLRDNLKGQAHDIRRELLSSRITTAPEAVAKALKLPQDAQVLESKRITCADDVPLAIGFGYRSDDRFPGFGERREVLGSVTETYKSYGVEDYIRMRTSIRSRQSTSEENRLLRQHPDMPVTVVRSIDALPDGTPIAYSDVVWSALRVEFTIGDT